MVGNVRRVKIPITAVPLILKERYILKCRSPVALRRRAVQPHHVAVCRIRKISGATAMPAIVRRNVVPRGVGNVVKGNEATSHARTSILMSTWFHIGQAFRFPAPRGSRGSAR